jgi:enamine deaminase RidA (YjgF/YER057c/UK114 family)
MHNTTQGSRADDTESDVDYWTVRNVSSAIISPAARYTMGRRAGPLFYLAGQIAAIPEDQKIISGYKDLPQTARDLLMTGSMNTDFKEGAIVAQSWFIWNNIKLILEEQGTTLNNILFVTTYILNMDWFPSLERVRQTFFPGRTYPPGTILEVTQLGLSKDILIEVEIVAVIPPER